MTATRDTVMDVLRTIDDPEMPISIVDLGMVEHVEVAQQVESVRVAVTLLPTFVGCPAIPMIEKEVRTKIGALPGVGDVAVTFVFDPPWSVDRISDAGRESLRTIGVTMPGLPDAASTSISDNASHPPACPFCGEHETHQQSAFGPTRCRMIYYCEACRNSFEHMKRV